VRTKGNILPSGAINRHFLARLCGKEEQKVEEACSGAEEQTSRKKIGEQLNRTER
jgi:hypothetical protein